MLAFYLRQEKVLHHERSRRKREKEDGGNRGFTKSTKYAQETVIEDGKGKKGGKRERERERERVTATAPKCYPTLFPAN